MPGTASRSKIQTILISRKSNVCINYESPSVKPALDDQFAIKFKVKFIILCAVYPNACIYSVTCLLCL